MKYKNVRSAIHNFGHSFVSYENYVDGDFVLYELRNIHNKGYDISINWLTKEFEPNLLRSDHISKSIDYWAKPLEEQLYKQDVLLASLSSFIFVWPANKGHYVEAIDDRGITRKKEIMYAS
nr:hypothetical protein [Moritella viscosa]SHO00476.1 Putative uncharacterized protein [Moritella viscosa]